MDLSRNPFVLGLVLMSLSYMKCTFGSIDIEKINIRRDLNAVTEELVIERDKASHVPHSYVFNSGVGNREELKVKSLKRDVQFKAGRGVVSWQSVSCNGLVYLLGHSLNSVSLLVTSKRVAENGSASFTEHTLNVGARVLSSTLFTSWNPATAQVEGIAVVAVNTSSSAILWYKITNRRLVNVTSWTPHRKTSSMTAVEFQAHNHLIIVDAESPATVDVFDVKITSNGINLDIRLLHNFATGGACSTVTVCNVGNQLYLILLSELSVDVYRLITDGSTSYYQNHTSLPLANVTQAVAFKTANQVYLALNGDPGYVLRVTPIGDFIMELDQDDVVDWLVMPVSTYRSDVVLLARGVNHTTMFVWAGVNQGFDPAPLPVCESCLEGIWSGAVPIPFWGKNHILLPRPHDTSALLSVTASLHDRNNPLTEDMLGIKQKMEYYKILWPTIQKSMEEAEEKMKYTLKRNRKNIVTAKWTLSKLNTPVLNLGNSVQPEEVVVSSKDVDTLENRVGELVSRGANLTAAVLQKEREVWGLDGYTGKITVKGRLIVENLTIETLNHQNMDYLLDNAYRKDEPRLIKKITVAESLEVENINFNIIKNSSKDSLKFSDTPVVINGNIKLLKALTVDGDVVLQDGGLVNGLQLTRDLCRGEDVCLVLPQVDSQKEDAESSVEKRTWKSAVAGRNLTVVKVNGVDWQDLTQGVVYKHIRQEVPGTLTVKGTVWSSKAMWADTLEDDDIILQKGNPGKSSGEKRPQGQKVPGTGNSKGFEDFSLEPRSDYIVSDMEVTGTVTCMDSEWGVAAADVVLGSSDPIEIKAVKTFDGGINVINNLKVEGLVDGVNMSHLLTIDTPQVFNGLSVLRGNISMGNIVLNGLWNGMEWTSTVNGMPSVVDGLDEVSADSVRVLESLNGVPVSGLIFTDSEGTATVRRVSAQTVDVTEDIRVKGEFCNEKLADYDARRLSIRREQNITGDFTVTEANVTGKMTVERLNNVKMSSIINELNKGESEEILYLSALHVEGDITTVAGVNGYNLTDVAANAVWLNKNNYITGHLTFKDGISVVMLECQGFFNLKPCENVFDDSDVVYKTNNTIVLTGKMKFLNLLTTGDLNVHQINGHKVQDILTKTTEQEIEGDVVIAGNIVLSEDSTLMGLLNGQNISELGSRCSLSEDTIRCKGNAAFRDIVNMEHLNCPGKINGVDFDAFTESMVDPHDPGHMTGFNKFTGKTTIKNLEVEKVNDRDWNDFLLNAVPQGEVLEVESPIIFTQKVTVQNISVDYNLDAESVNNVNISEWGTNAIYLNESFHLKRPLHLEDATSAGDLTVQQYGHVDMNMDLIKLHEENNVNSLIFESVTVTEELEIANTVNGYNLGALEENTLKTSGDQVMVSDLVLLGDVSVSGSLTTAGLVNRQNLHDVVTLDTDQSLHGKYAMECVEAAQNVSVEGLVSKVDMAEWRDTAVLEDSDQEVEGVWQVVGEIQLRGTVRGPGTLGGTDLAQIKYNISRDLLDVHQQLKANLSASCEETNRWLSEAQSQTSELLYLDTAQEIRLPYSPRLSSAQHFQSGGEDYLAISDAACSTTVLEWNKINGSFSTLYTDSLGSAIGQLVALTIDQQTYLVTASSKRSANCNHTGNHLWLFSKRGLKHISAVDLSSSRVFQRSSNSLYSLNTSGVYEWDLQLTDGTVSFTSANKWSPHIADSEMVPEEAGLEVCVRHSALFSTLEPQSVLASRLSTFCSGQGGSIHSVAVDPSLQFIAVASTEKAEVPRYSDHVKVYRGDGRLFDKLPVGKTTHLRWFPVLDQNWLLIHHNMSTLQLYQHRGVLEGFQLKISASLEAAALQTLSLPLASKVNHQPFLLVQTMSSVKIIRAYLEADPYFGPNLTCSFNDALIY